MGKMNWILLETYCVRNLKQQNNPRPDFCDGDDIPKYKCLAKKCPFLDFTSAENAFAYIGEDSSSKEEILLDSDSDLELWEQICRKKINEAWEEYTKQHPEIQDSQSK